MATDHTECADEIRADMARLGIEITVTTAPPIVPGPYTTDPLTCPHGTTYWIEPTGEQIARWARDNVA